MARRRDTGRTVEFDLEPDDETAPGTDRLALPATHPSAVFSDRPPAPGAAEHQAVRRLASPRPGSTEARRRRRLVAASGTLAVLLVAALAATASYRSAADSLLLERLGSATGGAVGLGHPPRELWSTPVVAPHPLAVLDGLLVVESQGSDPSDGVTLHALDPRTGKAGWSVHLSGAVDCGDGGAGGFFLSGPLFTADRPSVEDVDEIACLTGEQRDGVVVVGPGGRIRAKRAIEDSAAAAFLAVGPGGTLVLVDVVGGPDQAPQVRDGDAAPSPDGSISPVLASPLVVHDRRIRLEDAATGAALWTTTVPGSTFPAGAALGPECIPDGAFPGSAAVVAAGDPAGVSAMYDRSGAIAWYSTCGVEVTFDLGTGAVLAARATVDPVDQGMASPVRPLGGGAYAVEDASAGTTASVRIGADGGVSTTWSAKPGGEPVVHVFRPGGLAAGEVAGTVVLPRSTDGSEDDVLMTIGTAGTSVYDPVTTARRWTDPRPAAQLLVRGADELVMSTGSDLTALDPSTGAQRWRTVPWNPVGTQSGGPLGLSGIVAVYTDGRRAVLVEALDDDGRSPDSTIDRRWTAIDLTTGAREWRATVGGSVPMAIAGHLVRFDADAVVGMG
ncbi:MAG: PQQ-like beta-propeller repeat protein [Promicromonosporaceae bacterium]|nr:PQQ-like beta-propeller repeat protein [Promicromonosporaceae bacterium]